MKLKVFFLFITLGFISLNNESKACHAVVPVNFTITPVAGGINVNASSHQSTCGCTQIYWLDIEVRCLGEPFNPAPFSPNFYGPLNTYPFFQSPQLNKVQGCQLVPYATTFIPYTSMCPGITYQIRARENHNTTVSGWTGALQFTVPGNSDPLVVQANATDINICQGDCVTLSADVVGGCDFAPTYAWSNGANTQTTQVCPNVTTTYNVTVEEQCSGFTDQSQITINVLPPPDPGTASVADPVVCDGQTTILSLVGAAGNIQWQSAPGTGGPWTNMGGFTNATETTPPIGADICFRAEVIGCGPASYSNVVCVTMAPLPVLTVANETICEGQTTSLATTVDLTGGTYSWNPTGQTSQDLTNVSPAQTTEYTVTYDLNGCISSASGTVTVLPQPTTLNLTNQTICAGDNATIVANPDVPGGNYTWTPAVSTNNQATVSPGVGTNTYTINYGVQGCEITETVDVIVNPVPVVSVDNEAICLGDGATMTSTVDLPGGTYDWQPTGETTANINVNPGQTTTYTLTYTLNGCVGTDNATLTVNPIPVADFAFQNICEDQAMALNSTSTVAAPSAIVTYAWDIDNNGTVDYTTNNANHNFPGFGVYDINLTVTSDAGCTDDITQTVEVFALPVVDFTANPLCFGEPTTFTDQTVVPNGDDITNWNWNFDDGNAGNAQNPTNLYTNPGIYNVNLSVTTENGCTDNVTIPIEVYPMPVADFDFNNECYYDALSFSNTSSPVATIFAWEFGDGNTSTQENPSHTYNASGQYNVTLMISTTDGCGDTITQQVTAYDQPNANFEVDPTCFETANNFNDLSTINNIDGDNITSWAWDFGDGNTSSLQNPNHMYNAENNYTVTLTVTSNYGCVDTYTQTATVWPLPEVDFTPTDVCLESPTQFNDQSIISNAYTNNTLVGWNWNFGDGGTASTQNPTYTYNTDGTYQATLEVTSNHGCTNSNTLTVTVHPNPIASFTGVNLQGCSPVCFELNSTSNVNAPASIVDYTYTLSNGVSYNPGNGSVNDCFTNNSGNAMYIGVTLTVETNHGCIGTHTEPNYIHVYHNPIASFSINPEQPDVVSNIVTFNNSSSFADNSNWNISPWGSTTTTSPVVTFEPEPASYEVELIVSTNEGCTDTTWGQFDLLDRVIFYVPNTFTPDDDPHNPTFQPVFFSGFDPLDYNLLIFNRWGEVVFESNNAAIGWDGTYGASSNEIVRDGTYIWKIEFKETMSDRRHTHTGHVNVLR